METLQVDIVKVPGNEDLPLPVYMTEQAAGMDLLAAVREPTVIPPGQSMMIPTGISIALPVGYEAQIRPRSGLAFKHGITTLNSPGTIDADYRGEIGVILINHGHTAFVVERGMRIAQMVVTSYTKVAWNSISSHTDMTDRGSGGFGHTGL
ncbi:dUTP diphosphatase [Fodinisporobacter ferrooxydans]|uniref:Deoxyuridine 5'-triphosphate nucleotidohydrolase n=1 Tax=Fodinisporobacter ferrooxydans TaxID=2901836 RepID=A0ABY4CFU8_9BACL|nr:dUTP diphosphatase [Alicyclobacillaceae bacterium MYW30-H2]